MGIPTKFHPLTHQTLETEHSPQPFLQPSECNIVPQSPSSDAVYEKIEQYEIFLPSLLP